MMLMSPPDSCMFLTGEAWISPQKAEWWESDDHPTPPLLGYSQKSYIDEKARVNTNKPTYQINIRLVDQKHENIIST